LKLRILMCERWEKGLGGGKEGGERKGRYGKGRKSTLAPGPDHKSQER